MTSKVGPRELALRAQREAEAGKAKVAAPKPPTQKVKRKRKGGHDGPR